ncbi:DUF2656 family protein [Synechococcus lacustris Tous-12m]
MTIFIVSHNLQINSAEVPAFSAAELADALQNENPQLTSAMALNHPHWMLKVESELDVNNMAEVLLNTWRLVRLKLGHTFNHTAIALGGEKMIMPIQVHPCKLAAGAWIWLKQSILMLF